MWLRQVLNLGVKSSIGRFNPNFKPMIPSSTPLRTRGVKKQEKTDPNGLIHQTKKQNIK